MKKIIALALIALSLVSVVAFAADDSAAKKDEVRVYALNCGRFDFKDRAMFSDTGEYDGSPGLLQDPCFLIHHPSGWMIWDTGLGEKFIGKPMVMPMATFSVETSLVSQLAALGLKPADIRFVGVSHFHRDHTGNMNLFTSATWLIQKKELDYGLGKPTPMGVDPTTWSKYKTVKTELLAGDRDVFGDGKVKILTTPGHTPGHQSLLLRLANSGTLILSGDLYHQRENREFRRVPVVNFSRADTLASIDRIETIAKREHAKLVVQHDAREADDFPKFPEFLN